MKKTDNGFVSLFTAIMISMLLLVITVSMISVEAIQLRKSEDSEQTLRAYYLAEAGVEDAVAKVLSGSIKLGTGDNVCNSTTTYDAAGAAEWTCQLVTFSGSPTGKIGAPDVSNTVDPGHVAAGYQSVIVEWNQSTTPAGACPGPSFYCQTGMMAGNFPAALGYNGAPPLEMSILEYPSVAFKSSDTPLVTKLKNLVLVPDGGAASTVSYPTILGGGPRAGNCGNLGRPPYTVGGTQLTGYNCYALITNLTPGKDFLFRLRTRYAASAYRMTFKQNPNGTGAVVSVPDGTATIDVTAKAGDTYRRVVSKLPLNTSAASGLNFVIYSDTDICKNFTIVDNVPPPGGTCP